MDTGRGEGNGRAGSEELKEAEPLTFEPDLNNQESISWGHSQLNDKPAAIAHYETALKLARQGLS